MIELKLISIGSVVRVGPPHILANNPNQCTIAIVITIQIHDKNSVQYQCSWWDDHQHRTDWFEEFEVLAVNSSSDKRLSLGFGG